MRERKFTVLGAGLVGSLLSLYLAKKGHKVQLFEKRPDIRKLPEYNGRSINLALSRRGIKALKEVGVMEQVEQILIPMKGRMMHALDGQLTFQPYGKEGQAIYSVSRGKLNEILIEAAEKAGVETFFNHRCEEIDMAKQTAYFNCDDETVKVSADYIFGADGAFSTLRESMMHQDRFNYEQYYIPHGYKELCIPATPEGDFALEPNALHIWPRGRFMLIALPNLDKSFTCTLFLPFEGTPSFETLRSEEDVQGFFEETFPDALPHIPDLQKDFFQNPTSSLITVRCFPWVNQQCALFGDASHAIVPFYGQGMNAGFEDCFVFNQLMEKHTDNWDACLAEYEQLRKPDADAISKLALENFVEMRDRVANPKFLLRKKIEAKLHEQFPEKWMPLYSMVTFSDLRYSEALNIGEAQEKIMEKVMQQEGIMENWESLNLKEIVDQLETL